MKRIEQLDDFFVSVGDDLRSVLRAIDHNRRGIALAVDSEQRLIGTLTDGDLRRAILSGVGLDTPVGDLLEKKAGGSPVTAPAAEADATLLVTMRQHSVRQLPLTGAGGRVVALVTLDDILPRETMPVQAVIMAGGFGQRLRPLTDSVPKPMLPVGEKPVMELIIDQLRDFGVSTVNVTTHYHPEKIQEYFGDGATFGVDLRYVSEESPLGTAGALSLMESKDDPLLVINGDILTEVDFRAMLAYHREHEADLTVGVRQYDFQVPYGVIDSDGPAVTGISEKPLLSFFVNAGIYLLEPSVHAHIPEGQRFDMTDLIRALLDAGRPVASFPIVEYWLDIGQHADYEKAQEDLKSGRFGRE